jgi:hypothetical protein
MQSVSEEVIIEASKKTISTASLIGHIVERRIEYLIGTLLAYQMGLLDVVLANASQCIP